MHHGPAHVTDDFHGLITLHIETRTTSSPQWMRAKIAIHASETKNRQQLRQAQQEHTQPSTKHRSQGKCAHRQQVTVMINYIKHQSPRHRHGPRKQPKRSNKLCNLHSLQLEAKQWTQKCKRRGWRHRPDQEAPGGNCELVTHFYERA